VKTSQPAGEPKPKKTKKKEERKIIITGWQLIYRSCALFIFYFDIIVKHQSSWQLTKKKNDAAKRRIGRLRTTSHCTKKKGKNP
jgi:hypothetical protein